MEWLTHERESSTRPRHCDSIISRDIFKSKKYRLRGGHSMHNRTQSALKDRSCVAPPTPSFAGESFTVRALIFSHVNRSTRACCAASKRYNALRYYGAVILSYC